MIEAEAKARDFQFPLHRDLGCSLDNLLKALKDGMTFQFPLHRDLGCSQELLQDGMDTGKKLSVPSS